MPIYNYRCAEGHDSLVAHAITKDPEIKCDDCGQIMWRVPSVAAVEFKGSGFAIND